MLSALTETCILTERVGSVQDAGFFQGETSNQRPQKAYPVMARMGWKTPKVRFDAAAAVAMKDRQ